MAEPPPPGAEEEPPAPGVEAPAAAGGGEGAVADPAHAQPVYAGAPPAGCAPPAGAAAAGYADYYNYYYAGYPGAVQPERARAPLGCNCAAGPALSRE